MMRDRKTNNCRRNLRKKYAYANEKLNNEMKERVEKSKSRGFFKMR